MNCATRTCGACPLLPPDRPRRLPFRRMSPGLGEIGRQLGASSPSAPRPRG
jgi:hypothetical protein